MGAARGVVSESEAEDRDGGFAARGSDLTRDEIAADGSLAGRIRQKYRIKNTTGYAINALLDHEDPIDKIGRAHV